MPKEIGLESELPCKIGNSGFYGLKVPSEGLSPHQRQALHDYFRTILPTRSGVPYAQSIWRFVLSDDGAVMQVPRRAGADPADLPNPFSFDEVYDQLREGLVALKLDPPPPVRERWNGDAWLAASALDREVRKARETWKGWLQHVLASLKVCEGFPSIDYPPWVTDHQRNQMSLLERWIDERLSDGSLLAAVSSLSRQSSDTSAHAQ